VACLTLPWLVAKLANVKTILKRTCWNKHWLILSCPPWRIKKSFVLVPPDNTRSMSPSQRSSSPLPTSERSNKGHSPMETVPLICQVCGFSSKDENQYSTHLTARHFTVQVRWSHLSMFYAIQTRKLSISFCNRVHKSSNVWMSNFPSAIVNDGINFFPTNQAKLVDS
jgi:hypothetical protein